MSSSWCIESCGGVQRISRYLPSVVTELTETVIIMLPNPAKGSSQMVMVTMTRLRSQPVKLDALEQLQM